MKKNQTQVVSQSLSKRSVGRPTSDQPQGDDLKEHVIDAAGLVYSQFGYRDTSVAKIIEAAGISRPLFYRLFKSAYEVIDLLVARANQSLLEESVQVMDEAQSGLAMIDAGLDAYFTWCQSYGPVVGPIYREISDPESPASKHRSVLVEQVIKKFNATRKKQNKKPLPYIFAESLIVMIEHIGSSTFWPKAKSPKIVAQNKAIIRRIVFAAMAEDNSDVAIPSMGSILK